MTDPAPALKGRLPFRLGTTSYILPDAILPNVRFLAGLVDDIELVLFESDAISNLPAPAEIDALAGLAAAHGLTYTVHLPLDAQLGSADEAVRRRAAEACRRILALTAPLRPFAYVTHLYGERDGATPADDPARWHRSLERSVAELLDAGARPRDLCVETLAYPFSAVWPVVDRLDLAVCLDVGHVLMSGYPLGDYLARYGGRTRVVHLHGIAGGRDHTDISHLAPDVLRLLWSRLVASGAPERVVTLEVFSRPDFERSLAVLAGRGGT